MKQGLSVKEKPPPGPQDLQKTAYRRGFSRGLALGLILLAACVLLNGSLLYGQGSDDALFIDPEGNVGIGTNQPATKLDIDGTVNAKEFRGDGTSLTVDGKGNLKDALDKRLDKSGGTMTGDLTINSTGGITIPAGTTDQRQASPQNGALRYNTTTKLVEVFLEGMWFAIETTPYIGGKEQPFKYSGTDQTFTVPEGVTKIFVKVWGAGGAGGTKGKWNYGSYGGGGGFSRGVLTVIPGETLKIVVGSGGKVHQTEVGYGGGGAATIDNQDNRYCGGGGGSTRSGLFWGKGNSGGAGGGLIGENGHSQYDEKHSFGGMGGREDLAGKGGDGGGGPGEGFKGGTITIKSYGGGGGGGWKGGGSGYIKDASYAVTIAGTQRQCPMQNDPDYIPGVGIGGQDAQNGGDGLVVIRW